MPIKTEAYVEAYNAIMSRLTERNKLGASGCTERGVGSE